MTRHRCLPCLIAAAIAAASPAAARRPAGAGARAHQARSRPRDRRGPPARVRQLRRAPRALRLRRASSRRSSPLADADGFRKDVMDAARGLGVTLLRWPGGNFASGYNWKDGIGPRDQRPARRDHAWGALESNRFGTDEFLTYCERLEGRAVPLHQRRARLRRGRPQLGRIHERVGEHLLGAAAAQERPRQAVEREDLGPRQRDRRALAARPQERRGLRQVRARGGEGHAPRRRVDQADRLRLVELRAGLGLGGLEPHRARAAARTRSTTSRSTPTSATATNNFEQFLAFGRDLDDRIEVVKGQIQAVRVGNPAARPIHIAFDEWNVWYRTLVPGMDGVRDRQARASRRTTTSRTRSRWACS